MVSPVDVATHFLRVFVGPSFHVSVNDSGLALGEFQRRVLIGFEGPRWREIEMRPVMAA